MDAHSADRNGCYVEMSFAKAVLDNFEAGEHRNSWNIFAAAAEAHGRGQSSEVPEVSAEMDRLAQVTG